MSSSDVIPGWTLAPAERRRVSMASERQRRTADSLTLSCPGLSVLGLSDQTGQYRLLSGLQLASEPIRNRTCTEGPSMAWHHPHPAPPLPGPRRGLLGAKVSGWADLCSPAMFGHVHTQNKAQGGWLEYGGDERGQEGCGLLQSSCVCMYVVGMAIWPETAGPPDLPRKALPPPDVHAALVSGLFVG